MKAPLRRKNAAYWVAGILAAGGLALACAYPLLRVTTPTATHASPAARESSVASRAWLVAEPQPSIPLAASCFSFEEVTDRTGINFQHTDGSSGRYYIVETVSSGLATFDYDGDGLVDIYFPNGAPLPGFQAPQTPRHALYRNLGDWRFAEVTDRAGVGCTGYGLGATAGDYDNDGCPDLYVSNFGPNFLYRNNGDGTFTDVTEQTGTADGHRLGAGVAFLDANGDGWLDLFVANYVLFSYSTHIVSQRNRVIEYIGPKAYPPERLALFLNNADGTFTDATDEWGIGRHPGKGMGLVCADYDNDGDTDIFLLNDVFENFCFQNDGQGHFEEVALANGFKYNAEGVPLGSMGVDCGDYDNDGWFDFYQTSYQRELPVLFRSLANGIFEDVTVRTGAGSGTLNNVKWGCGFVDFDNDGFRDLFVAMGHLQDRVESYDSTSSYRTHNVLLWNTGQGRFVNISEQCGLNRLPPHSARGAAFEDFDNDGDIDVVVLNSRETPSVLRNNLYEHGCQNHWLRIRLEGVKTNRGAVGARVRVVAGDLVLIDEVHSGRGYQSHWGSRLHFGLGTRQRVDRIEVRWIGGGVDVLEDVAANQLVTIREGSGSDIIQR